MFFQWLEGEHVWGLVVAESLLSLSCVGYSTVIDSKFVMNFSHPFLRGLPIRKPNRRQKQLEVRTSEY